MKLSSSTVNNIITKIKITGSCEAGRSSGRPRITSRRDDIAIGRCAKINPTYSSLQVKASADVRASARTVRRRLLSEFGLRSCRPARKPLLNQQQRMKRIKFCKKYLKWTVAE